MKIGNYQFTEIRATKDLPSANRSGLLLLEVKETGELHVISAGYLGSALATVLRGVVGTVLTERFKIKRMDHLKVYYWDSGCFKSTAVDKQRVNALILDRLVDPAVKELIQARIDARSKEETHPKGKAWFDDEERNGAIPI